MISVDHHYYGETAGFNFPQFSADRPKTDSKRTHVHYLNKQYPNSGSFVTSTHWVVRIMDGSTEEKATISQDQPSIIRSIRYGAAVARGFLCLQVNRRRLQNPAVRWMKIEGLSSLVTISVD